MASIIYEQLPMKTVTRKTNDHLTFTGDFRSVRQLHFHAGNKLALNYYRIKVYRERKILSMLLCESKISNLKSSNFWTWWKDVKIPADKCIIRMGNIISQVAQPITPKRYIITVTQVGKTLLKINIKNFQIPSQIGFYIDSYSV